MLVRNAVHRGSASTTRWLLALAIAAIVGAFASPALATNNQFYAAAASPGSVAAGSSVVLTVRNCATSATPCTTASNAVLGSAKATLGGSNLLAGALTAKVVNANNSVSTKSWTATLAGDVVSLAASTDSDRLSAGQRVEVEVKPTKVGVYTVVTSAYYYKTFASGPSSYSFQLKGASPSVEVTPGPLATLAFVQQPTKTEAGATVAPPVTVSGVDAYGNAVSGPTVTLAIGANPGGGTLTGTTSALVGGVATFGGLSIDKPGLGYTLTASSSPAPTVTSLPFDVFNVKCDTNGQNCSATTDPGGAGASAANPTIASVDVIDTGTGTVGDGSLFIGLGDRGLCAGVGTPVGSGVTVVPNGFQGAFAKVKIVLDRSVTPLFSWKYHFCADKSGATAPTVPGNVITDVPLCLTAVFHVNDPFDVLSWLFNYSAWTSALNAYVTTNGPCILYRKRLGGPVATTGGDLEVAFYFLATDPKLSGY